MDTDKLVASILNTPFPNFIQLINEIEQTQGDDKALSLYQLWLKLRGDSPQNFVIYFNMGVIHGKYKQVRESVDAYRKALSIKPDFTEARINLALNLEKMGLTDESIAQLKIILDITSMWEKSENAEHLKAQRVIALNHIGRILEGKREYALEEPYLQESLELDSTQVDVIQHWSGSRQRQCKWPVFSGLPNIPKETLVKNSSTLLRLAQTDDPNEQLKNSVAFLKRKAMYDSEIKLVEREHDYGHKKIRIGYVSSDLQNHAVAFLTVAMFEKYNDDQFEVHAFSWSDEDNSEIRKRIKDSVDKYHPISHLDDLAAAKLIREYEIDIVVDLHGLTSGARPNIFVYRPAPFSVTYLGLPATTGHPEIDYVISDDFLIPDEYAPFYSEKPLHIKPVFQMSDDQRPVGKKPTRKSKNLPDKQFVFCCFNNNYKFNPQMFLTWMNILKRVPDSVLWLLADNEQAKQNMIEFAELHNVDTDRLIFSGRVMPADYLAQYQCADLFLDAFPFNGGTTANDVLFMDLPIVTYSGMAFASRMAGALLHALGLDEMITYSYQEYEDQAVKFATDHKFQKNIKNTLKKAKKETKVFDSEYIVKQIEMAFLNLVNTNKK